MVNFTILAEEDTALLSMERFRPLLNDDLNCTAQGMTFSFNDEDAYNRGKEAWEWVNESDDRKFILITSIQDCDSTQKGNKHRVFWRIKNVIFHPRGKDVEISAEKGKWEDFIGSFIWNGGDAPSSLGRRDSNNWKDKLKGNFDKDTSDTMNLDYSFGEEEQKSFGDTGFTWACKGCGSTGKLRSTYTLKAKRWKLEEAVISFTPEDISLNLNPALGLHGVKLKTVKKDEFELFRKAIPPNPVLDAIKEWFRLGPYFVVRVGYSISHLEAEGTFTKPYSVKIKDGAKAEIVIKKDSMDATSEGWEAEVSDDDLDVDGTMSGDFRIHFNVGVVLTAEVGSKNLPLLPN